METKTNTKTNMITRPGFKYKTVDGYSLTVAAGSEQSLSIVFQDENSLSPYVLGITGENLSKAYITFGPIEKRARLKDVSMAVLQQDRQILPVSGEKSNGTWTVKIRNTDTSAVTANFALILGWK
jgi:hypothetical protein